MSLKLIVTEGEGGQSFEFLLTRELVRIGRAAIRNDLVLDDGKVSREHAVLQQIGGSYLLKDLNSANGVYVNGQRVTERIIKPGDVISISKYNLTYKDQTGRLAIKYGEQQIGNTVLMRAPSELVSNIPWIDKGAIATTAPNSRALMDDIETLRKKAETLARLYELNQMLGSVFSLEDIFKKASEMMFRLTAANRFLVMLKDTTTGELSPISAEFRDSTTRPTGDFYISKTVLERVVSERMSLLSFDAQADERLAKAQSIIIHNIQSIMCAPLLGKESVIGVIYLDCQEMAKTFNADDLDLLNAIAAATSIAVDNAVTHKQLLREALARATYSRFMPQHVVDEILANPETLSLGGSNQMVTTLFSDIRGFTTMSESLPPENVVRILNEYFTDMTPIIFEHYGMLDKYMGDGLMALFGVPYPREDAAANAIAAAIDMQRRMAGLNKELKAEGLSEIEIGIGINTGTVTVGYIGSLERTDYTAIGDPVNLAARLEKQAQPGQILISHSTREAVGPDFPVKMRGCGQIQVKGKKKLVQVYEVVWQEPGSPGMPGSE